MFKLIKLFLIIGLIAVCNSSYSQSREKLCICFDSDTQFIEVVNSDSLITQFIITRDGFETEEKIKEKREQHENRSRRTAMPFKIYDIYYGINQETITSIKELPCAAKITLEEFRKREFSLPKEVSLDLVVFVKNLPNKSFLIWDALNMRLE